MSCTYCHSPDHSQFHCRQKPRTQLKARKRLKKLGKHGNRWLETRAEWFRQNPAEQYECYLQITSNCLRVMTPEQTTLDHVQSRSRYPQLRYELSNLRPACWPCNMYKGSLDVDELAV
jgi:5-methylcytosine-specific restriction endonuclease McrA